MKPRYVVSAAAALLVVSLFAGVGAPLLAHGVSKDAKQATVTVNGTGTVNSVPDTASVSLEVVTDAGTAADALRQNSAEAAKVIEALKNARIAAKDIQTQSVSLQPRMNDAGNTVVGYRASNSVSAVVRDLSRAGAVIDAGVAAGANSVSGPSLSRGDADALYRDALKSALVDARAKAEAIASAGHFSVGALQSVTEGAPTVPIPLDGKAFAAAAQSAPIEPGTQQIQATVTVTYAVA